MPGNAKITLTNLEKQVILSLQLLIARAAQKDSLSWWEDDSLTPSGMFLLERLFVVNPGKTGRALALEAARVRYQAAFGVDNNFIHPFHLDQDGTIAFSLQDFDLSVISFPPDPIISIDALRQQLLDQAGSPLEYQVLGERSNNRLEIKIKSSTTPPTLVDTVKTLTWASLEGQPGKPVFPFIQVAA
jgi:hypothetical protein